MPARPQILGTLLVETEGVDASMVERVLTEDRRHRERIGQALVRIGATTEDAVARALAIQLGTECATHPLEASPEALSVVRPELLREHSVLPLSLTTRSIRVAMADPLDLQAIDDIQFQTGRRVDPVVTTPSAVDHALACYLDVVVWASDETGEPCSGGNAGATHESMADSTSRPRRSSQTPEGSEPFGDLVRALPATLRHGPADVPDSSDTVDLERETRRAPVVRLVDRILRNAIDQGASDIHVEETGADVRVRLRIDGYLEQSVDLPAAARRAILSRIKVIAGMDIAVRRRAQDGRLGFPHRGRDLMLRVSTLPVNGGEKAVVRILDAHAAPEDLGALGMGSEDLAQLRALLERGEGVILAAGPTGSGKSTTLHAALCEVDRERRNVVTVEDPVEYRLAGASHVQVDRRAGLSFADALRAILRQDPDVVMVGEIRDRETAEIAMAAAVTGHLVLSTIHTTDAPGAVTRLLHMGVPPFLIAGGLSGVVAQRLVRRICEECRGAGCDRCTAGLRGRTGVYQVLTVSDTMRDEISGGGSSGRLRRLAAEAGMKTLDSDARRAVAAGLTTPHEIARVLRAGAAVSVPCAGCALSVPFGASGCPHCGRLRGRKCACGHPLERGWRFCPSCVRPAGLH
jgi:type IV pilus assembly protein PilB